jgi:glycosyltransferase involved in cell wall biosynthesis
VRVLYVSSRFPYPLTSGLLRHYHFIRELSSRHEVTFVSLVEDGFEPEHADAMRPLCERLELIAPPPVGRLARLLPVDARLLLDCDAGLSAVRERVRQVLRETSFDAAYLAGKRVVRTAPELGGIPTVLDLCDVESMRIGGRLRQAPWWDKPRLALGWALMRTAERWATRWPVSEIILASVRDSESLGVRGVRPVAVPNGVDCEYWSRTTSRLGERTIAFTGGMHYAPNADAALLLVEKVLPLVRESVPDAELLIVGKDPSPQLRRAGERHGAVVTGFVDDVRPYVERATVIAAPIRFGAGIQNKLLEALAMQVPVVASALAADGLRPESGERPPIETAESASEIAAALVRRLESPDRSPKPELREFVERHFSWSGSARRLERLLSIAPDERAADPSAGRSALPAPARPDPA